uniref:Uncharacterized protein n=1 Tax=Ixodes ricinus TaxID=34613 RepID=A0A6B0TZM0_IXORI
MLMSILARTSVMADVTRQTCARPSCITTAATSACWVGSQARSSRSKWTLSHTRLARVNLRFISRSKVW